MGRVPLSAEFDERLDENYGKNPQGEAGMCSDCVSVVQGASAHFCAATFMYTARDGDPMRSRLSGTGEP